MTSAGEHVYGAPDSAGRLGNRAGPLVSRSTQSIEYSESDLPLRVTTGSGALASVTEFDYTATADRAAKRGATEVTYYAGDHYQRTDDTTGRREHRYVVYAGGRPIAQVNRTQTGDFVAEKVRRYLHTDAQGSISLITYDAAAPAHRSYSAFGRTTAFQDPAVVMGYTGHEHDLELGLINMNARMYDPVAARFLTPDPVMSEPFGVGVNPYAYAGNNPIDRTDPTGMSWDQGEDGYLAVGMFTGLVGLGVAGTVARSGGGSAPGVGSVAGPATAGLDIYRNYQDNKAFTKPTYQGSRSYSTATDSAQQARSAPGSLGAGADWAPGGTGATLLPLAKPPQPGDFQFAGNEWNPFENCDPETGVCSHAPPIAIPWGDLVRGAQVAWSVASSAWRYYFALPNITGGMDAFGMWRFTWAGGGAASFTVNGNSVVVDYINRGAASAGRAGDMLAIPGILSFHDARRFWVLASFSLRSGAHVPSYAPLRCSRKPRQNRKLAGRAFLKVLGMTCWQQHCDPRVLLSQPCCMCHRCSRKLPTAPPFSRGLYETLQLRLAEPSNQFNKESMLPARHG